MKHSDILKQLFPIELGGDFDADIAIEGKHLDDAMFAIDELLKEIFPDTAYKSLSDWERLLALLPSGSATVDDRRKTIVAKLNETGGLSREYYIRLAKLLGFEIEIKESDGFFECGIDMCGWPLGWNPYVWVVNVITPGDYSPLEETFNRLKPAHTQVVFKRKKRELRIELTDPANGANDIPCDKTIVARFSAEINASTINPGTVLVTVGTIPIESTYDVIDRVVYVKPVKLLPQATTISIKLTTGIKGMSDESLPSDYLLKFNTYRYQIPLFVRGASLPIPVPPQEGIRLFIRGNSNI